MSELPVDSSLRCCRGMYQKDEIREDIQGRTVSALTDFVVRYLSIGASVPLVRKQFMNLIQYLAVESRNVSVVLVTALKAACFPVERFNGMDDHRNMIGL